MIPKRHPYSGQSYKLYDDYNDVHVFIEDSGFENFYKLFLKNNGIKIENVFSKNGKNSIIDAAKLSTDPKCVYVVDRDWDELLGGITELDNLIVLDKYSIENYFLDYDGFCGIVLGENPRINLEDKFAESDFDDIAQSVSDQLRILFECFVSIQMEDMPGKSCSYGPGKFQQQNSTCAIDADLVEKFVDESGVSIPREVSDYFSDKLLLDKGHGKYMLHFIWEGVRNKSNINRVKLEKVLMRLGCIVKTEALNELVDNIKSRIN